MLAVRLNKKYIIWTIISIVLLLTNHLFFYGQLFYSLWQVFTCISIMLAYQDYYNLHIELITFIFWLVCLSLHPLFNFPTYLISFFLVEGLVFILSFIIYRIKHVPAVGIGDYLLLSSSILVPLELIPLFLFVSGLFAISLWVMQKVRDTLPFAPAILLGIWVSIIVSFYVIR